MDIQVEKGSRLEKIIEKLLTKQDLINKEEKGEIEIHFKGNDITAQIKVMVK